MLLRSVQPSPEHVHRRRWAILALLCTSLLIVVIGNTTLNVTLPVLSRELGATESQLQWVVAVYSLVFAGLLFTTGALGDRFGRKGALQLGLLIFLVGSVVAAFSSSMTALIACRAVMGAGAAFIMPSTLSILINVFPPHERPKAIAIWASFAGAGGSFGPLISGALLAHFWWGSIFLINVPLVLGAIGFGAWLMPTSRDPHKAPLDPGGALLSTVGVVAIVYALIEAPEQGWLSGGTMVAGLIGVGGMVAFVMYERRTDDPMLDMSFFRNPAFSVGVGGMILVFLAMYGWMFLTTQYFQEILGFTPLGAAARLFPPGLMILAIAPNTPRLITRFGAHRVVASGMLLIAAAMFSFRLLDASTSYAQIMAGFFPMAAGMALASAPMTSSIMSAVPPRRAGAGSSMNDATRELGAALGVAVLGSLAGTHYSSAIDGAISGLTGAQQTTVRGSLAGADQVAATLSPAAGETLRVAAQDAFIGGLHLAVTVGAVAALVAAGVVLKFLPRRAEHQGAVHSGVEALEATAELVTGGAMPIVEDDLDEMPAG